MDNTVINIISNSLGLRYILNLITVFILFRFIYFRNYRKSDLFLTFFGFNSIIFFISFMLNKVEISTGAGFGLFAVFSVLRYRTEGIGPKDMTYLFISIALGLLTAIGPSEGIEIGLFCFVIILLTFILENSFWGKKEASKIIIYDSLDFINESQKQELIADLKSKTGIEIHRISIDSIDYLKDSCIITIYFYEN